MDDNVSDASNIGIIPPQFPDLNNLRYPAGPDIPLSHTQRPGRAHATQNPELPERRIYVLHTHIRSADAIQFHDDEARTLPQVRIIRVPDIRPSSVGNLVRGVMVLIPAAGSGVSSYETISLKVLL
jgi:hypothetical protein